MSNKRLAKLLVFALVAALVLTSFAGCAKSGSTNQVVKFNLGADPKTIDPALNDAVDGATVIVNAFDGLTRLDKTDTPVPAIAEKWDVSADGTQYTFHLRKDAKWSDGKPVTAQNFEYAWKRALDPKTASNYAYQLYYIKNGEAFNNGKATVDQVGVKATDDYTLEVTLEAPTAYFLSLTAFPTLMPVRQDIVEANPDKWATDPATYVVNGPFKLKSWTHKDKMIFEKNENYWNAKSIKLSEIDYYMLENDASALSAYQAGQIDVNETIPLEQVPSLLQSGAAKNYPYLGTYYMIFNVGKQDSIDPAAAKALSDVNVRKALTLAIDRKAITENVTKGGQIPAGAYVPNGIADADGKDFRTNGKDYYNPQGDVAQAQKLLADAGYPNGQGFPKMTLMYNTSAGHQAIAQAIQEMWRKNLNINVELANQEWKVFQTTRQAGNFEIARGGWIADYSDPMTFLDMWTKASGNNDAHWYNDQYDQLITQAKRESDPAKRMTAMHQAEDLLMKDMPIIPIYYYSNVVMVKDYVKDLHKSPLGFTYFDYTTIQK